MIDWMPAHFWLTVLSPKTRQGLVELEKEMIDNYIKAINKIDDYFEYANESIKDRAFIHKVLEELTNDIRGIPNLKEKKDVSCVRPKVKIKLKSEEKI